MIKGIMVELVERIPNGIDEYGAPIYEEKAAVKVENVLVAPTSSDDITDSADLASVRNTYQLAIPKGDSHRWTDGRVTFFGKTWQVIGSPLEGIEANIPTAWHKKVTVEEVGDA